MYHGWNDQLIQPYNSIDYFTSVQKKMGARETDDFARLFMAPGMQHCAGGVGSEHFDAVTALEQWVEKGRSPRRSSRRTCRTASSTARGRCARIRKWRATRGPAASTRRRASCAAGSAFDSLQGARLTSGPL